MRRNVNPKNKRGEYRGKTKQEETVRGYERQINQRVMNCERTRGKKRRS